MAHVCNDIDVTPEMVDAGVRELIQYDWQTETESDAVKRIYRAMRKLNRVFDGHP